MISRTSIIILRELELCKGILIDIREAMGSVGEKRKSKLMCTIACALIFHHFGIEHIPTSRTDFIDIVNGIP